MLATVCARSCKIFLLHLLIQAVHVAQIWRVLAIQCTLSYGDSATVVLPSPRYYTPNITVNSHEPRRARVCVSYSSRTRLCSSIAGYCCASSYRPSLNGRRKARRASDGTRNSTRHFRRLHRRIPFSWNTTTGREERSKSMATFPIFST